MKLIDSHAHLTSPELIDQADELVASAQENGVEAIVNICTDLDTLAAGLELKRRHPSIHLSGATHPHDAEKGASWISEFRAHALQGDLVAIGETGLDYYYSFSSKEVQQDLLKHYLELALEVSLPVIIHCRDAFDDFFKILDVYYKVGASWGPGVLHCFTGTAEEAQEVLKRGWYLSFSGILTYKKSDALRKVAAVAPLEKILIETDSPYLAPQPFRGKVNQPAYVVETAKILASVKNLSLEEVARATANNTRKLFQLSSLQTS